MQSGRAQLLARSHSPTRAFRAHFMATRPARPSLGAPIWRPGNFRLAARLAGPLRTAGVRRWARDTRPPTSCGRAPAPTRTVKAHSRARQLPPARHQVMPGRDGFEFISGARQTHREARGRGATETIGATQSFNRIPLSAPFYIYIYLSLSLARLQLGSINIAEVLFIQ